MYNVKRGQKVVTMAKSSTLQELNSGLFASEYNYSVPGLDLPPGTYHLLHPGRQVELRVPGKRRTFDRWYKVRGMNWPKDF